MPTFIPHWLLPLSCLSQWTTKNSWFWTKMAKATKAFWKLFYFWTTFFHCSHSSWHEFFSQIFTSSFHKYLPYCLDYKGVTLHCFHCSTYIAHGLSWTLFCFYMLAEMRMMQIVGGFANYTIKMYVLALIFMLILRHFVPKHL